MAVDEGRRGRLRQRKEDDKEAHGGAVASINLSSSDSEDEETPPAGEDQLAQILFAFKRNEKATKKGTAVMKEMKRDLAKLRKTVEMHEARFIRTDSKIMGIEKKLSEEVGILKELIEDMKKNGIVAG